jgi:hypothetical protein
MALDSTAVVLPGTGHLFLHNTPGTAPPADTAAEVAALNLESATIATGWNHAGHTSRENNVTLGRDGGDRTTRGSWQSPALRETVAPITWTFGFKALQISNDNLAMYFGGGSIATVDRFDVPDSPTPVEKALFVVMVDGSYRLPIYIPKVSCLGGDPIEADVENFLELDIVATVLKNTGTPLMSLFNDALGAVA